MSEARKNAEKKVAEAMKGLLADGVKPTQASVLAWLKAKYGEAGSLREIAPALSEALADYRKRVVEARAVASVVDRFARLDPIQRSAARVLIDSIEERPRSPEIGPPSFGHSMQEETGT